MTHSVPSQDETSRPSRGLAGSAEAAATLGLDYRSLDRLVRLIGIDCTGPAPLPAYLVITDGQVVPAATVEQAVALAVDGPGLTTIIDVAAARTARDGTGQPRHRGRRQRRPDQTGPPEAAGYQRRELVELARLCSIERWATRVMLRAWREVLAPAWEPWRPAAAIAYSANSRHDGRVYRFDGWAKVTAKAGNPPGPNATWSRQPVDSPARGAKTLWLWAYQKSLPVPGQGPQGGDRP